MKQFMIFVFIVFTISVFADNMAEFTTFQAEITSQSAQFQGSQSHQDIRNDRITRDYD